MIDIKKLSKIGIGTWGIGGYMERDDSIDEAKQVDAIAYMLSNGMNFVEANMFYSEGYSVEILAKAIKKSGIKREDLFVCQAIYLKGDKRIPEAKSELERVLELLETDYIDTIQFSMGSFLLSSFEEITEWIDEVLESNKSRFTSITNANLDLLKQYHEKYGSKLFSHEVVFNFEMRPNEELGIIGYGEENDIKTVVYQPLRRNRTAKLNWEPIKKLAEKYGKSQNQIIMSWIVSKGYLPLTKSETISHIDEHLDSLKFEIEQEDLDLLSNFKLPNYTPPKIDWYKTGEGVSIDQLSNVFEEIYKDK
jgi:diketogulonate reductase-like aldo/keto reductase